MLRLTHEQILASLDQAVSALDARPLVDALAPPVGPNALFHHLGHATERVKDVALLYQRLSTARRRLSDANAATQALRRHDVPAGEPYPPEIVRQMDESGAITHAMKVDFEAIFHFGSVLLDQCSLAAGYLAGLPMPNGHVFRQLVPSLDRTDLAAALEGLRDHLRPHARWLHFWMRTYRNAFVVHGDRPWQRGTVAPVVGDDFVLFTPSPPGWERDAELEAAIRAELPLAPEWLRQREPGYWERDRPRRLLERIVENIGQVDRQADRDRIANLARRVGLTTPTFQVVVSVLSHFVSEGLRIVRDTALLSPQAIVLGIGPGQRPA